MACELASFLRLGCIITAVREVVDWGSIKGFQRLIENLATFIGLIERCTGEAAQIVAAVK